MANVNYVEQIGYIPMSIENINNAVAPPTSKIVVGYNTVMIIQDPLNMISPNNRQKFFFDNFTHTK